MTNPDETSATNWTTYAYGLMTIVVGFLGAPLTAVGLLLLVAAATPLGKLSGVACILVAAAIQPITWKRRLVGSGVALAALALVGIVVCQRAAEEARPGGPHVDGRHPASLSPFALVSELDQLTVRSTLVSWFETNEVAEAMPQRDDLIAVYGDYADAFAGTPSLLDDAVFDECSGRSFVWPRTATGTEQPDRTLLLVHGYGGSWTGTLRVARPVAETIGATLVQPSCGMGLWTGEPALTTFTNALAATAGRGRVDVVALSNGGLAVSRRLEAVLERASSLVFVSPAFDLEAIAAIPHASRRIPVLVLVGSADERVPMPHVEAGIERLKRLRLDVRLEVLEGAGHAAFLHDRDRVRAAILDFLAGTPAHGAGDRR